MTLLSGCAAAPRHVSRQPASAPAGTPIHDRDLDVHAKTSLFSGGHLPAIEVLWRGDPRRAAGPFNVHADYYDADYNRVTSASKPGRYGAIVEITTERGQTFRRYLSLYRFPEHVDWDYVRIPTSMRFPKSFGVDGPAVEAQHANFSEFLKYMLQRDAERTSFPAMILAGLHEATPAGAAFVARDGFEAIDQKWWTVLKRKRGLPGLPYRIHLPAGYAADPDAKYPCILALHGSGEAGYGGEDLAKVAKPGSLMALAESAEGLPGGVPFIVIAPQCPPDADWSPYDLERLMEEVEATYHVDRDREYLTGLSLGGYGTWDTALAFPHRFAAIAPMSGAGDADDVTRIKDLPCWIFHGEKDTVVPVEEARRIYDALVKVGGRAKLSVDPQAGHNSWSKPYHDPEFYQWLIAQRRTAEK